MATQFITGSVFIAENTTGTTVLASGSLNQSGYMYSVVVPQASGAPSVQQVIDGQDSASGALAANFVDSTEVGNSGDYVVLSGISLTSETDYTIYFSASGYDDGLIAAVSGVNFTTPDITAPSWSGAYPTISSFYGVSGYVILATDEAGSGWALAVASGAAAPTVNAIQTSGIIGALTGSGTTYITLTGLSSETDYAIYAVAQDDESTPNVQSSGWLVGYASTTDITAPVWSSGYPQQATLFGLSGKFNLAVEEDNCSGWVLVQASGAGAPTASAVKSSGQVVDLPTSGLRGVVTYTGLVSETDYQAYAVAQDDDVNLQSSGWLIGYFTTTDITAPGWSGSYPTLTSVTGSGVTVNFASNDTGGSGYALAQASGAVAPTAAAVVSSGQSVAMPSGNTAYSLTYTGLVSETDYQVYTVANDEAGNLQSSGWLAGYLTTSDITAPSIVAGYPTVTSITVNSCSARCSMNDDGVISGVCILSTAAAPNASQIIAFTDGGGNAVPSARQFMAVVSSGSVGSADMLNLQYSTYYTFYAVGIDDGGNQTSVGSVTFRTAVPAPGVPGRYSMRRVIRERQRLRNQVFNTLRGM